jgi:hypothetical protein
MGSPVARQSLDCMLRRLSSIYVTLREGGHCHTWQAPRSGHELDWFPNFEDFFKREGDHIHNSIVNVFIDMHDIS